MASSIVPPRSSPADLIKVDPHDLIRWNLSVPRYTSYPTAPQFAPVEEELYRKALARFDATEKPLSLYLHVPFCQKMCLFCGCSVVLNRNEAKQNRYLECLLREIEALRLKKGRNVTQLHLGGGTPTSLQEEELERLMNALRSHFTLSEEIGIEIDPRTVFQDEGRKLKKIRELGWNRVSFGVQDLDPRVQEAVRRRQTEEMTVKTYERARELGFHGINLDLIYGLPYQTVQTFTRTIEKIIELRPDRIALFSYAKVPWLKPHQKAIPEDTLPSTLEKFTIYTEARERLMQAGYLAIGMDHFSLPEDSLSIAFQEKKILRNFQGYSVSFAEDMIGLGMSSIGYLEKIYFQNEKTIEGYESKILQGALPVALGYELHAEDLLRSWVVQKMMCHFEIRKEEFAREFSCAFDLFFAKERAKLNELISDGLIIETKEVIQATSLGKLMVRLIASVFDAYLNRGNYSKAV